MAGAGAGAEKITQFRLRLRLHYKGRRMKSNCNFLKFLIIIVEIIFGVKKIKMFIYIYSRTCICNFVSGKKINFLLLLRIHRFLPYNSPGAGAGAVLFLKGRSRSRSRRKSGGSATLDIIQINVYDGYILHML